MNYFGLMRSTDRCSEVNASIIEALPQYVKAIMDPGDSFFDRLNCPAPKEGRYEYLRTNAPEVWGTEPKPKYFFALDLHDAAKNLPRLVGSIVEAIRYLGPNSCALSIVEGRSQDGTLEILEALQDQISALGVKYYIKSADDNPEASDRIQALATLRNLAVEPLVGRPFEYSKEATIIFINDVSLCMEDILELIHQKNYQGADMTCAMDWTYVGHDPTFYDVWVARGLNGDSFFEIPEDGNWNSAWNIFWNNPTAQEHYRSKKSFQVFSCWNGATAFTAKPFLEKKIAFRKSRANECDVQGEPQLFCKDMWLHGYKKIAVVPSVNLEYSDEGARKIKSEKGYTSQWAEGDSDKISWEENPPDAVKCMQGYAKQTWVPWNEGTQGAQYTQ